MSDRELLEKAARAIGRDFEPNFTETFWNPLQCDKDAFRLAAKRLMSINNSIVYVSASTIQTTISGIFIKEECIKQSVEEATRRAITRAAAVIGEQL